MAYNFFPQSEKEIRKTLHTSAFNQYRIDDAVKAFNYLKEEFKLVHLMA